MSTREFTQRGAASCPLYHRIADHYLTSYVRDFQPPQVSNRDESLGTAGCPTPHTKEIPCLPGVGHSAKHDTANCDLHRVPASQVCAAVVPPCDGGDACLTRLTNAQDNPRRCETTYGDDYTGVNTVRNPLAEYHQCSILPTAAAPAVTLTQSVAQHGAHTTDSSQKKALRVATNAKETFAAMNTFKTTYGERFNDASSVRALVPPTSCTDTSLITPPKYGPPSWGVNEKPPPYLPGAEFTYPSEKPIIRHVRQSTTHASYQHRTRKHDIISYDAGGDAASRSGLPAASGGGSSTSKAAPAKDGNHLRFPGTSVSRDDYKSQAGFLFSGTNCSATAPRRYRLFEALQAVDRRHDSFALAAAIDREKRRAEADAAAKIPPQPASVKPTLHDMFEKWQKSRPLQGQRGLSGDSCKGPGGAGPCGDVPYAGLDAFHESVNKFAPMKAQTSTKKPYCKPWQPLTKIFHPDAEPISLEFTPTPIAPSDGFIPVCPTVRHDGRVSGMKRKDWKPEGCTVQA